MPKCPYCDYDGGFKLIKMWKFISYNAIMLQCLKCGEILNHYYNVSPY